MKHLQIFNEQKTILVLYEQSGVFSQVFYDLGFDVVQVDKQLEPSKIERWEKRNDDVRLLPYFTNKNIFGIISHPPCTQFALSGNRWRAKEKEQPSIREGFGSLYEEKMVDAMSLVDAVFRLKQLYDPAFWFIENPTGTLSNIIGQAQFKFNPNEFAGYLDTPESEAYTKKTQLWGAFKKPFKREVEAIFGSKMWSDYGGKSQRTKNARSKTPEGFARAFAMINS